MRLFYALTFQPQTLDDMEALQSQLQPLFDHGRLIPRENLHLTLAFLGDIAPQQVPVLRSILESLKQTPSFCLCFDQTGTFGGKQPVLYLAPQPAPALFALEQTLRTALKRHGFPLETRPFTPHVTLIRNAGPHANGDLLDISFSEFSAQISSAALMLSERQDGKLVYTPLASVPFKK